MESNSWIDAILIANFDEQKGAIMENIFDFHTFDKFLSDKIKSDMSFLSFPDKNQNMNGYKNFHFCYELLNTEAEVENDKGNGQINHFNKNKTFKIFGFVCFCQLKDSSCKRGFIQKSLLILSRHMYISFFSTISKKLFQLYIDHGLKSIEIAINLIKDWPAITINKNLDLPFYGDMYRLYISPYGETFNQSVKKINMESSEKCFPPSVQLFTNDVDFSILRYTITQLHYIYELLLLEESILILGHCPSTVTQYANALLNLINPLEFMGVYFPYFTIQLTHKIPPNDKSSSSSTTSNNNNHHYLIGVTNPYFKEVFKNWKYKILLDSLTGFENHKNGIIDKYPFKKNAFLNSYDRNCLLPIEPNDLKLFKKINELRNHSEMSQLIGEYFNKKTKQLLEPIGKYVQSMFAKKIDGCFASILEDPNVLPCFSYEICMENIENFIDHPFNFNRAKQLQFYDKFIRTKSFHKWLNLLWNPLKIKLINRYVEHITSLNSINWRYICNDNKSQIISFINCLLKSSQLNKDKYIAVQDVRNRLILELSN